MSTRYSLHLRVIHWMTAVLIAVQIALALLNIALYEPRPILAEALVQAHISLGSLLFLLTLARLAARWCSPAPPRSNDSLLRFAGTATHAALYGCLFALPITGYLKLAALGFTVTPFGFVPLPPLDLNVPVAQFADQAHDLIALGLGALLVLHIAAAVFHRHLDGRRVLHRISFGRRANEVDSS
ncbi:MAG: cytochrome b/b6 domain-containing protein [Pseudomonadota bacterium]